MKKINTILIGLGNIGFKYDLNKNVIQTHTKAILKNKNFNLLGAIDRNKKRIKDFKKQYNLPVYSNLKNKLIKKADLIVLAVPTKKQLGLFYKITQFGYKKNFLFEKPFTINKKIIFDLTKIKNRKFFINYYRNFDNILIKTLKKVKNSEKNLLIKAYYSKGFYHNFSHYLTLFIKIFGKINKFQIQKKKKLKNDYVIRGKLIFKKIVIFIYFIDKNKECNFHIFKNKNKIWSYENDGLKIKSKFKKYKIAPNLDYMANVYKNIRKIIYKKNTNYYDINNHLKTVENLTISNEI
tara:strand:+ start:303 stop:1184 length:882 start_codon:yes stop_codon:yes gene_type:complete